MKQRPPIVRTLDASLYARIAGELRKNLPGKVIIDIDRGMDEKGKSIVTLRCRYPEVAKKVIAKVLGEEYVESETEVTETKPKQWWQRSIASGMGEGKSRSGSNLSTGMTAYAKKFQEDVGKTRKRIYQATRQYEKDAEEGRQGYKRRRRTI